MKLIRIFISILLFLDTSTYGQSKTIYGRVVSEDLEPLPYTFIQGKDKILFGKTDTSGRFKIEIPQQTQTLLLNELGFEETIIKLKNNCDTLEIIMMYEVTYDFISPKKIDKLRFKRFNKLPALHIQAFKKGFFSQDTICYSREFKPDKPIFDEMQLERRKKDIQLKPIFEKLKIGDTVKIPFSGKYRYDGTDRTTLFGYNVFINQSSYDYVIRGVVIGKNKKHKGYNLIYKVIDCDKCPPSNVYNGRTIETNGVFECNMRYYKVLVD